MAATYGWIITTDKISDPSERNSVGVMGPYNISAEIKASLEGGQGRTFRMYDDDNIHYYSGRIISFNGEGSEDDFGPLDDYGTPNAGCTDIRYYSRDSRKWESL